MTEQTKLIFSEHYALRSVLQSFLQTPQKLSIYAKSAQKFFSKNEKLEFRLTWSWWGFFGGAWFFFYRKLYALGFFMLFASCVLGIATFIVDEKYENFLVYLSLGLSCFCAIYAKFAVIKRFERLLDINADLDNYGGVNEWAIYVGVAFSVIMCIFSLIAGILIAIFNALEEMGIDEEFLKEFEFREFPLHEPQQTIEAFLNLFGVC